MKESTAEGEILTIGGLEVRPAEFEARAGGRRLDLTVRELELLGAFARRADRIVSREELFAAVWGARLRRDDRSVDVFVRKLRHKLEQAEPDWRYIHTHVGFGYRFAPEPATPENGRSERSPHQHRPSSSHHFHNGATDR